MRPRSLPGCEEKKKEERRKKKEEEGTFLFSCAIVAAFPSHGWIDHASLQCWSQLVDSATSAAAHLHEAGAGGTRPQFLALNRGALREIKESHSWIRLIVATKRVGYEAARRQLDESDQLTSILTTIVKNTIANTKKPKKTKGSS